MKVGYYSLTSFVLLRLKQEFKIAGGCVVFVVAKSTKIGLDMNMQDAKREVVISLRDDSMRYG